MHNCQAAQESGSDVKAIAVKLFNLLKPSGFFTFHQV